MGWYMAVFGVLGFISYGLYCCCRAASHDDDINGRG